jgi:hypothetical protein
MSRKRSRYRPRAIISDPLTLLRTADPAQKTGVMLAFLTAIDCIATGDNPGEEEWRSLSDAINTVETIALHFGKLDPHQVMPIINRAIAGMAKAANRYRAGKGMRLDADGLLALREVIDIYGICLDGLTAREMSQAQAETQRRVNVLLRRADAGNVIAL